MNEAFIKEISELSSFTMSYLIKELAEAYACILLDNANFESSFMSDEFDMYVKSISIKDFLVLYKYVLDYSYENHIDFKL